MKLGVEFHPIRVLTGGPEVDGVLVVAHGGLAGVLVRLAPELHSEAVAGRWFVEAAFSRSDWPAPVFESLESAALWFLECHPTQH